MYTWKLRNVSCIVGLCRRLFTSSSTQLISAGHLLASACWGKLHEIMDVEVVILTTEYSSSSSSSRHVDTSASRVVCVSNQDLLCTTTNCQLVCRCVWHACKTTAHSPRAGGHVTWRNWWRHDSWTAGQRVIGRRRSITANHSRASRPPPSERILRYRSSMLLTLTTNITGTMWNDLDLKFTLSRWTQKIKAPESGGNVLTAQRRFTAEFATDDND